MKATKQAHDWHCHNHDTYGWRGDECKQCSVTPSEVEQLVFRNERLVADYASLQEENNALRRIHAENIASKDAEIARWKAVPMKYRRMEFNAQLQDENAELSKKLTTLQSKSAALVDALEGLLHLDEENHQRYPGDEDICLEVRNACAALAAFKGEK